MTEKQINNLKPNQVLWDNDSRDSIKGLHVKCFSSKKTFYFYYRAFDGVQRRPKVGDYPQLGITDARKIAKGLMIQVLSGKDPSLERKRLRAEEPLKNIFAECLKSVWGQKRYQKSGWDKEVRKLFNRQIASKFGSLKLSTITVGSINDWHTSLESTPIEANRALSVLSRIFTYAEEQEYLPVGTNPCQRVKRFTERKRVRVASPTEIKRICEVLEKKRPNYSREITFIFALMYSGARPESLETARWMDLKVIEKDGQTFGVLTFSGKTSEDTGEDEVVVFPPVLMGMISEVPKVEGLKGGDPKSSDLIFGIKMPRTFWDRVKAESGVKDLWIRDWRRTFASLALSNGVKLGVVGELLNHRSAQTTKRYAKLFKDERLKAVGKVSEVISDFSQTSSIDSNLR